MKEPEYIEGREATRNFEDGMKSIFKVPKDAVVKKDAKQPRTATSRKSKRSDKD
jgi:hypothetical protein